VARIPPLERPLQNDRVTIRDAAERDIPEILIAYQDDPQMHVWFGIERPPSGAELGRQMEREPELRASGAGATWTILEPGSDVCRGQVNVHHLDWEHARGELGVWLAPQVRGQGFAQYALRLVSEWLFEIGLQRVHLMTDPGNEAMTRSAAAAGFVNEGVLRSYQRERGKRVDVVVLSLLPTD
jgi:RimJ/RimL family protein N-acetyltransferase